MSTLVEKTITATEFKARCLELMDQLAARTLDRVTVTKRGRIVSVMTPPPVEEDGAAPPIFGWLKGSAHIPAGFDWEEPLVSEADMDAMVEGTLRQLGDRPLR